LFRHIEVLKRKKRTRNFLSIQILIMTEKTVNFSTNGQTSSSNIYFKTKWEIFFWHNFVYSLICNDQFLKFGECEFVDFQKQNFFTPASQIWQV
jgi:hypothetical protein